MDPSDRITGDDEGDEIPALLMIDAGERALRSLVARCRTVAYVEARTNGWSVQQIADELGVSYQAINKALRR